MGWGPRGWGLIYSPARQDGCSSVIAIPCSCTRALLRGCGAPWQDQD